MQDSTCVLCDLFGCDGRVPSTVRCFHFVGFLVIECRIYILCRLEHEASHFHTVTGESFVPDVPMGVCPDLYL